ncbi:DUF4956 domain-containing protein [Candidatus Saccharibacteria bacterium]|nr:DUF4956 domain-containing protein [Candidatus Saccharibacteria bacterium]
MQFNLEQLITDSVQSGTLNNAPIVAINLLLALVLGVVIAKTYKKVHKGVSYSVSYAYSIVLITMIVAFVMMVIGGNLAKAFTLLGAFTLIRFRTAVKDPKDTAFIFLALVVGLSVGSNGYTLAILSTLIIVISALLLDALNFGSMIKLEQVLYLTIDAKKIHQKELETMLRGLFKEISIINVNYSSAQKSLQYSYNVKLKKRDEQTDAMMKLTALEGVKNAEILASQQVVEF